jgi:hypothetical protein
LKIIGLKWKKDSSLPKNHPLAPKSPCSGPFFEAVKIYTLKDLRAKRQGGQVTRRHAVMNGSEEFAKSQKSNAPNADIVDFCLSPMMLCVGIYRVMMILARRS